MKKRKGGFAQNTAILAMGNVASQIISISLVPVITRLYSAEEFGEFSIIAAIAMTIIPISSLRFHAAILLPENELDSRALMRLSFLINVFFVMALAFLVVFAGEHLSQILGISSAGLVMLLPVIFMLGGWQLIVDIWALRNKCFSSISLAGVGMTLVDRIIGITLGILGSIGSIGLLFGRAAGLLTNVSIIGVGVIRKQELHSHAKIRFADLKRVSREYKNFAIYSWSAMVQQASRQAPIFLLGILYSSAIAGLYALCFRVLAEPVHIIGAALGRSFAQRAAEDSRNGKDISGISLTLYKYLLVLIMVPMTVLAVIAPGAFRLIFGADWERSGEFVQYVAPVFMLTFMFRSFGALFDVLRKQKEQMVFGITMLLATLGSIMLGAIGFEVDAVLIVYSSAMFLVLGSRIIWLLLHAGVSGQDIASVSSRMFLDVVIFGALAYWMQSYFAGEDLVILLFSATIVCAYYVYVFWLDAEMRKRFSSMLPK